MSEKSSLFKQPKDSFGGHQRKMIIADDEAIILNSLKSYFSDNGFDVTSVFTAEEALQKCESLKPEILLTDIDFGSNMTGFELCRHIRSNPQLTDVELVVMSGGSKEKYEKFASAAGAVFFIPKPPNAKDLSKVVTI